MSFVDKVTIHIRAGHGGPGAIAFRREKFVAYGGPWGGDGGKGGDVVIQADPNVGTLMDLRYRKEISANNGDPGGPAKRTGKSGQSVVIRVPVGTLIRHAHTLELLGDLTEEGEEIVIARGGQGGQGNARFRTSTHQTPRFAQDGMPGDEVPVILELKLLADVGIVGYPSVGKSTLISVISNARPKIADYHFTTLTPNLGIVKWHDYQSYVVADIPGLIEGAHEGHGLGHQFLRHVERCRVLLHVLEVTPQLEGVEDGRSPIADFEKLQRELRLFSEDLAERPQIVALSKMDLPEAREAEPALREHFEGLGYTFLSFSSATREGIDALIDALGERVAKTDAPDAARFTTPEALPLPVDTDPELPEGYEEVPDSDEAALRSLLMADDLTIVSDD